ncbi:23S rRNA-/tRNA-specific pseudouridylate synthase [Ewingella americana]
MSWDEDGTTRVKLRPITGRSHQLRVHLLAIGHPILGDKFYAPPEALGVVNRLQLHAQELSFYHPITDTPVVFNCEPDF